MPNFIPFEAARDRINPEDFLANEIRSVFLSAATVLTPALALPHFGGTGTTDLSANEVTGGNFPANGFVHGGKTATGDPLLVDVADLAQVAADAANPSNIRYEAVVDFTRTDRMCLGYFDYGADQDAANVPVDLNYAAGLWSVDSTDT